MQLLRYFTIAIILFVNLTTSVFSETSWITKKSDKNKKSEVVKKVDGKYHIDVGTWIKKKTKKQIKKDKKEYKKEEKKITKEAKSWITKKTKTKYISSISDLPEGAIYFTGYNNNRELYFYGYVKPDSTSELIDGYYKESIGFGFFDDGKTICNVSSTVLIVDLGEVTARISGKCENGIRFAGKTTQTQNSGYGVAKTSDGKNKFNFDFNISKDIIANLYEDNKTTQFASQPAQSETVDETLNEKIDLKPVGNYYALLIGNSNYEKHGEWDNLVSPKNDVKELSKLLRTKYKFKKVITAIDVNRDELFKKFEQLAKITTDKDYVLIYYSGHGDVRSSQSYWIPINASLTSRSSWININDITTYIEEDIKAHHIALLVDSCYFAVTTKSMTNMEANKSSLALEKLLNTRARIVLASGQSERVEDAAKNRKHSRFGLTIINSLKANNDVIKLYDIAQKQAIAHATVKQKPYYAVVMPWGHLGGDFLFIAKR